LNGGSDEGVSQILNISDASGKLDANLVDSSNPRTTTYEYNSEDLLLRVKDTDGYCQAEYEYDAFARVTKAKDATGTPTNYTENIYDIYGRVKEVKYYGNATPTGGKILLSHAAYMYDLAGRRIQTNQKLFVPTGDTLPSGRMASLTNGTLTQSGHLGYDSSIHGSGVWIASRIEYDRAERPVYVIDDKEIKDETLYDGLGRVKKVTSQSPSGDVAEYWYDAAGNAIETKRTEKSTVSGTNAQVFYNTMFYDSLGRLMVSVDNAGRATDYRYNSLGQLIAVSDPNAGTGVATRTFNRRGETTSAVTCNACGNVTYYEYDWLGRKTKERQVLTSLTASPYGKGNGYIGFDLDGKPVSGLAPDTAQAGDGYVDVTYEYDTASRLWKLTDDNGSKTEWTYDCHGQKLTEKKGIKAPSNGTQISWSYLADGPVGAMTKEDGAVLTYTYDAANRVTNIAVGGGSYFGTTQQTFAYDGAGRVVQSTDNNGTCEVTVELSVTTKEVYESLGRLLEERQWIGSYSGVSNSATPVFDHP